jgi:ABC-2 type transport system permease protein
MAGVATVYRWELAKLRHLKRTYLGLGMAVLVPVLFVIAVHLRRQHEHGGGGLAFTDYVDRSGLAIPLIILLFGAIWLFPLIAALVAGDIVAAEDHVGTLKTVLTRSLERWQLFLGKGLVAFSYACVATLLCGTVGVIAGSLQSGFNPLQSLSGTIVSAPRALLLVYISMFVYLIPIGAIVCIGLLLSTITRNSAAAVVGTLMLSIISQLIGILPGLGATQPYLLSTQFNAWQGLLRTPIDTQPIVRAVWVSGIYAALSLGAAFIVFVRRDVTG